VTESFGDILRRRLSRRALLRAGSLAAPAALLLPGICGAVDAASAPTAAPGLGFTPIAGSRDDAVRVAPGYAAQVVMRWGDAMFPGVGACDPRALIDGSLLRAGSAAAQERQFGYNCDAIVFFPLDRSGRRGLLCVNHEYTNDELLFPDRRGMGREGAAQLAEWSRRHPEAARLEIAAHGVSVLEIELVGETWRPRIGSRYTRRVTGRTLVDISGPARGHELLRTKADPSGTRALGTLANCAGGRTPWGTYLTAEENIDDYFGGFHSYCSSADADSRVLAAHRRFPLLEAGYHGWEHTESRFDVRQEPNEALRFGWIVEIDPEDPSSPIRKRTALGRFSHESAACAVAKDGRVTVYMGDDDKFEYVFKFVTRGKWNRRERAANRDLLDAGVLHVARFDADGTGAWLPLVQGQGPLTAQAGFADAGEVVVRAREAADLLGATPMDRPEDVAVSPLTGRVYVTFTKNGDRTVESRLADNDGQQVDRRVDAANPRPENEQGHILEILEDGDDAAALRFRWNVFMLAGDPRASDARYLTEASALLPGRLGAQDTYFAGYAGRETPAPMACPDNLGFDPDGNLWIVTDGTQPRGDNNGAFAVPVTGPERGYLRQFMSAPVGAEVCGCEFTPDGETLFLSIQHPGEGGTVRNPTSHWPDGDGLPPRPSVIAIRKRGGGRIGS
jgi:secreted PhoX family phosphatase